MIYWEAGTLISLMGLPSLPVDPRPSETRRVTKRRRTPAAADTAARETLSKRRAGMTTPSSATKETAQEFATTIVVGKAPSSSKGGDDNSYSDGDITASLTAVTSSTDSRLGGLSPFPGTTAWRLAWGFHVI